MNKLLTLVLFLLISFSQEAYAQKKSKKQTRIQDSVSVADQVGIPEWLEVDVKKLEGTFKAAPEREELPAEINESLIVELYSK